MKIEIKKIGLIIVTFLCFNFGYSIAPPEPAPGITPPPMLPIDGGLYILVLFSLLFAGYKLLKYKKRVLN